MENNKIIIALLIIIIALLVVFGVMYINPTTNAKINTKITVTSNNTLHDGDSFSIALTDVNGTPLANQTVNITIIDANGAKNQQQVKTDGMGNGILQLKGLTHGEYTFNVTYGGNDNYSVSNMTQKIEIKEIVKEESKTQSSSTGNAYVDRILNDPSCHVVKDPFSICPKHGVPYYQDKYCDWFIQPLWLNLFCITISGKSKHIIK